MFINGILAVDLGGLHVPLDGSVTVDANTAKTFGLTAGGAYKISVFHAERKQTGSSFKLTLAGFNTARSDCSPVCGDGVVQAGEQCDDGSNGGGYGECGAGCVLGEFCGDGIQQAGEDCDDGNMLDGDACPSSCRVLVVKRAAGGLQSWASLASMRRATASCGQTYSSHRPELARAERRASNPPPTG